MIKILGILDLLAAALLTGIALGIEIPTGVLIFIPACLFLKACVFISDPGSMADFIIVMLFVSNVFLTIPPWILFLGTAFLGVKGTMSLFA